MNLTGRSWTEEVHQKTDRYWYDHENDVLNQQFTYRQMDVDGFADIGCDPCHDEWQGEEGDDAATGRQGDR